ncbi:MAG TPA: 2-amino-4-hydroxy-6-hydroxymethyldihydropteridine diphosphokinase [Anaeromyxobacteraceae bacterium]|nr:2-amino-4-hydroxy-6-hydroxymethyldihydropteridine diphosphokinase [Anaeromyxobacteraceae bacterium]
MRAFVGVGSNLGDRWALLALAARALRASPGVALVRASRVWDSAPVGPPQPRFLNAVLELETSLPPRRLLQALLEVERAAGRVRRVRLGARTLDLDLLLYGDRVLSESGLTVPHPAMASRRFVLAPLAELGPGRAVPGTGATVGELLASAPALDLRPVGRYLVW